MGPFVKHDARVRSKRLWLLAVMAVSWTPLVPLVGGASPHAAPGVLLWTAAFFALAAAFARTWREERGTIHADETALRLGERVLLRRNAVHRAQVVERDGRTFVECSRGLRRFEVEVGNADEAQAMLVAMRLDAARSVARYNFNHGTWRRAWTLAGALIGVSGGLAFASSWLSPNALAVAPAGLFLALCACAVDQVLRITVGADGVSLRRGFRTGRFLPFSSIASAKMAGHDIELLLTNGERIRFHHAGAKPWKYFPTLQDDKHLDGEKFVERVEAQRAAAESAARVDAALFARGGRTTREWLRDVAGEKNDASPFRTPAVPPEALWRIVEDTTQSPTARVGAAVALRANIAETDRSRLRVVADACAAPQIRFALEAVANEHEDLLTELDQLQDATDR